MSESGPTLGDHVALADEHLRSTFSWYVVAKKEYKDAIRSKGLWLLALVFTILFILPAAALVFGFIQLQVGDQTVADLPMEYVISNYYLNMVTTLIPIIAMFVGFGAVTNERESGSLKILLSLPHSRKDVIAGKVLGRCAVVGLALLVAYLATALFFVAPKGFFGPEFNITFNADLYVLWALYSLGLALVFVAIAVSISGAVSRGLYSLIGNFVVYFYFTFGWNALANAIGDGLQEYVGLSGAPRWHATLLIKLMNPSQAYKTLTNSMLGEGEGAMLSARYGMFSQGAEKSRTICGDVLGGAPSEVEGFFGPQIVCEPGGGGLPFYYSDAAVFVYLLLWIGVAALVSYKTFNLADL